MNIYAHNAHTTHDNNSYIIIILLLKPYKGPINYDFAFVSLVLPSIEKYFVIQLANQFN